MFEFWTELEFNELHETSAWTLENKFQDEMKKTDAWTLKNKPQDKMKEIILLMTAVVHESISL